jgi:hypothetical protein
MRIAAVIMTTGLLMGTTAAGIAAVNQAVTSSGSSSTVSAESAVVTSVVDVNSVLPAADSGPALPSIKKLLKKAQAATIAPVVAAAPVAAQQPVAVQQPVATAAQETASEDAHENDD